MSEDLVNVEKIIVNTGRRGLPGASAYQSWLASGNTGTEADFLLSLKGEDAHIVDYDPGDLTLNFENQLL